MAGDRGIRASDADRDRSAAALSAHYAAGRVTLEEFQERLNRAYVARTLGDLDDLVTDLPRTDSGQLARPPSGNRLFPVRRTLGTVQAPGGKHPIVSRFWLGVAFGAFVTWLISGASVAPWFLVVAFLLAFIVLRRWTMGVEGRINEHHRQPR